MDRFRDYPNAIDREGHKPKGTSQETRTGFPQRNHYLEAKQPPNPLTNASAKVQAGIPHGIPAFFVHTDFKPHFILIYGSFAKNRPYATIIPMDIISTLPVIQIILAVLLTVSVLLQQSDAGAGSAFGGSDSVSTWKTRRGFEKFLFFFTIVVAILFVISAIVALRIG